MSIQNFIDTQRQRVELHNNGHTQVAYKNEGGDRYTMISANSLAERARSILNSRMAREKGDKCRIRDEVRASLCAGKMYSVGILTGNGEELTLCVQWQHEEHNSYFRTLPSKASLPRMKRMKVEPKGAPDRAACDTHGLAADILRQAVISGVRIRFTTKCARRDHVLHLFETDNSMQACCEIAASNVEGRSIRLDVAITNTQSGERLFCVEVLNTHKTIHGSRDGFQWCEVVAARIIDAVSCDNGNGTIIIPTEPREDVHCHCVECDRIDAELLREAAERADAKAKREELAMQWRAQREREAADAKAKQEELAMQWRAQREREAAERADAKAKREELAMQWRAQREREAADAKAKQEELAMQWRDTAQREQEQRAPVFDKNGNYIFTVPPPKQNFRFTH